MTNYGDRLGDYVEVNERITAFIAKYPEGSLRFDFRGVMESNPAYIWGIAYAYRYPDDPAPGIGTAQELADGKTPYTRGSELMNLETSAWGRACAALGIGINGKIATRQEVRAAQERQSNTDNLDPVVGANRSYIPGGSTPASEKQRELINQLTGGDLAVIEAWKAEKGIKGILTASYASDFIEQLLKEKNAKK